MKGEKDGGDAVDWAGEEEKKEEEELNYLLSSRSAKHPQWQRERTESPSLLSPPFYPIPIVLFFAKSGEKKRGTVATTTFVFLLSGLGYILFFKRPFPRRERKRKKGEGAFSPSPLDSCR